jgi:hypothetical protein
MHGAVATIAVWARGAMRARRDRPLENPVPADLIKRDVRPILLVIIFVFALDPKRTAASVDCVVLVEEPRN